MEKFRQPYSVFSEHPVEIWTKFAIQWHNRSCQSVLARESDAFGFMRNFTIPTPNSLGIKISPMFPHFTLPFYIKETYNMAYAVFSRRCTPFWAYIC